MKVKNGINEDDLLCFYDAKSEYLFDYLFWYRFSIALQNKFRTIFKKEMSEEEKIDIVFEEMRKLSMADIMEFISKKTGPLTEKEVGKLIRSKTKITVELEEELTKELLVTCPRILYHIQSYNAATGSPLSATMLPVPGDGRSTSCAV